MLFNSITFILIFLPSVLVGYYILRHVTLFRFALAWLSLASLFFYAWWNPLYLALLLSSIVLNFMLGKIITCSDRPKLFLIIGIIGNLAAIGFYKYLGFFSTIISGVSDLQVTTPELLLPLAISFFTFQQIAYLVDVYRGAGAEKKFDQYLLFVSFFPQLIAGPIVHHKDVAPQFSALPYTPIRHEQISSGLLLFVIGLAKKVIIADQLSHYATPVFSTADSGGAPALLDAWGGLLAYALQLYFDFSGYADMAVGLAKMFGINLPINFDSPYKSANIVEFWRRWHITLSHFLRDYLYITLGGSKRGSRSLNLFVTMLLGGLWHGAGWNFVIWGGLHGTYLIVNHWWAQAKSLLNFTADTSTSGQVLSVGLSSNSHGHSPRTVPPISEKPSGYRLFPYPSVYRGFGIFTTFLLVSLTWSFFRAESLDGALSILRGAFGLNGINVPQQIFSIAPYIFSIFADPTPGLSIGAFPHVKGFGFIFAAMFIVFFLPNSNQIIRWFSETTSLPSKGRIDTIQTTGVMVIAGVLFALSLKIIASSPNSEFLYFNF
ncbi:MBOAT family protein [Microbulbifer sp. Q7]|uniref:MBOAT family O-acyltransferase n=1 Tax=Microbulbifer sp. Q7 TaxID=1785091 RepID=UPI0008329A75|nr:MBOAT family O-acyltransferase [Microbulbifer sp. Q7]